MPTVTPRHSRVAGLLGTLAIVLAPALAATPSAHADVLRLDSGAIVAGRPIYGTGQNLPPLDGRQQYVAGPGRAQITYYTSGEARQDQAAVASAAYRTVKRWIRVHCGSLVPRAVRRCGATVVFDIDETLLSNLPQPASGSRATVGLQAESCPAVNPPVTTLYSSLRARGIRVAIVTGREASERADTIACLHRRGIAGWSALTTRPAAQDQLSAGRYKKQARRALERQGLVVVASIGDQISDMAYGHLRYGFLLPNPIYWIP